MVVSRRLRASVAFALMLALVVSTGVLAQAADEPAPETEITKQVEITVSDLMPTDRDGRYYVEVRLHNKTRANLAGPIYIAVESLGVDELSLDSADSKLSDGRRSVRIVSDVSQIRANADSASKRVYFKSDAELTAEQTEKFDATLTVWQGKKLPAQTRQTTERRDSGFPTGQSTAESGQSGRSAGPMPDPAFEKEGAETGTEEAKAEDDKQKRKELKLPTDEEVAKVIQSQNQLTPQVTKIPGVLGTSTTLSDQGTAVIRVMVKDLATADLIPKQFNGVPVVTKVVQGDFVYDQAPYNPNNPLNGSNRSQFGQYRPRDLGSDPDCPPQNPQRRFQRPVPIGVSVSNDNILLPCSAGTLGCRVKDRFDRVYILSNSHVLANNGLAPVTPGDPITQPAPLEILCTRDLAFNVVADLSDYTIPDPANPNNLDAAIARTFPFMVGVATPCDGYGAPRENVIPATLGMRVMKYGRTTALKSTVVTSINVQISIQGNGFINLIAYEPSLSTSGDSGSLVVSSATRESVGLHFAGLQFQGISIEGYAMPIQSVLDRFNVTIDGDPSLP